MIAAQLPEPFLTRNEDLNISYYCFSRILESVPQDVTGSHLHSGIPSSQAADKTIYIKPFLMRGQSLGISAVET